MPLPLPHASEEGPGELDVRNGDAEQRTEERADHDAYRSILYW